MYSIPVIIEIIRLKVRNNILLPLFRKRRRNGLFSTDFTIISNNCWAGTIYESYGITKNSPTVGMFIMPKDYLKFISNLDYYLEHSLEIVPPEKSKWKSTLCRKKNWGHYVIGKIDDIELHMLHYHNSESAIIKWNRRKKRINRNNIIFKFNDQNGATVDDIKKFCDLSLSKKICFVSKKELVIDECTVLVSQPCFYRNGVVASREPYGKNITNFINTIFG